MNATAGKFDFGENWKRLIGRITESHVHSAVSDIAGFMKVSSLQGMSFLDIGCGSGLSSLAAYRLGASEILSIDLDPQNIANLLSLRRKFGVPDSARWASLPASIVAEDALEKLPQADIVYSWGVLHHTGKMWFGLENCAKLVKPGGYLYIMIYRDAVLASTWKRIKRIYSASPRFLKSLMHGSFAALWLLGLLAKGRNPIRFVRDYNRTSRGMDWYLDVIDWVGGYPFEYASAQEVCDFLAPTGFRLINIEPPPGRHPIGVIGVNHRYLFRRDNP